MSRNWWTLAALLSLVYPLSARAVEMVSLVVDKATLTATLQTWPEGTSAREVLSTFPIVIGKAKGDKQREGDNRTPEGIYFTQTHKPGKDLLASKYGPLAVPLNFPNPMDRLAKKTGYGIWLHGAGDDKRMANKQVTEGCVAFFNEDILTLQSWLPAGQVAVVIADNANTVNIKEERIEVLKATESWAQAWGAKDIDGYMDFYAEDFRSGRRGLQGYKKYKKRVFNGYDKMEVRVANVRVVTHPKYAISVMDQDFNGDDRFVVTGRKVLYWTKSAEGDWRIVREVFENNRIRPLSWKDEDLAKLRRSQGKVAAGATSDEVSNSGT